MRLQKCETKTILQKKCMIQGLIIILACLLFLILWAKHALAQDNRDYWNRVMSRKSMRIGNNYSLDFWKTVFCYNSIENTIIENCDPLPEQQPRILDVATGHGTWAFFMRGLYPKSDIIAIDIADTLRAHWRKYPFVNFHVADICDTSLALGRFDIIVAVGIMHHLVNDDRFELAIRNMSSMLVPGGMVFIVSEFTKKRQIINSHKMFRPLSEYIIQADNNGLECRFIDNDDYIPGRTQNDVLILKR